MTALHEVTGYDAPATRELTAPAIPRQRTAGSRHGAARPARATTGSHRRIEPRTGSHRAALSVPAPRAPETGEQDAVRVPRPRATAGTHRRPAVLLAALVAGAAVAGWFGMSDVGEPAPTSVLAAQEALLGEEEAEIMPMASITEAQAQARLEEVAASRQDRADAAAAAEAARQAAIEAARPKAVFPVKGATLTSSFGPRWGTLHQGVDLAAPMYTPEYAAADGVVLRAGAASGFGLAVYILHENGDVTVYGHMDSITVTAGDYVEAGDTIALLGNTGESTGPHLHFEVRQGGQNGAPVDPITWLRERGVDA